DDHRTEQPPLGAAAHDQAATRAYLRHAPIRWGSTGRAANVAERDPGAAGLWGRGLCIARPWASCSKPYRTRTYRRIIMETITTAEAQALTDTELRAELMHAAYVVATLYATDLPA